MPTPLHTRHSNLHHRVSATGSVRPCWTFSRGKNVQHPIIISFLLPGWKWFLLSASLGWYNFSFTTTQSRLTSRRRTTEPLVQESPCLSCHVSDSCSSSAIPLMNSKKLQRTNTELGELGVCSGKCPQHRVRLAKSLLCDLRPVT